MPRKPTLAIATAFGAYEAECRRINGLCDDRMAQITANAKTLAAAIDACEDSRARALARAFADYQAQLKAAH